MKRFGQLFALYCYIIGMHIKTKLAYRADFVIGIIAMLIMNLVGFYTIWMVLQAVPTIGGWNFHQMVLLYGFTMISLTPNHLLFSNAWMLGSKLMEGSFIKYLLRPVDVVFYYFSESIDINALGQLAIGIYLFSYAYGELGLPVGLVEIAVVLVCLAFSSLVMIAMSLFGTAVGFKTLNPSACLLLVARLKEFSHYPLTIFDNVFRFIFTFVLPIGFVGYYPARVILADELNFLHLLIFSLLCLMFFALAVVTWRFGAERYVGTGS